ncbi:MAG: hypothetical protein ACP5N2_06755 [Candidatus Nanoarchaeia archaeon]
MNKKMNKNIRKQINKKINKKGFSLVSEIDGLLFWCIVIFVVGICAILAVAWAQSLKDIYVNAKLEPIAYDARLVYSDYCFAYKELNRVYVGTIDPNKFNEITLRSCLPLSGVSKTAIAVELKGQNGELVDFITTENWKMNTQRVKITTYFVNIKGNGPGTMNIYHKEGE